MLRDHMEEIFPKWEMGTHVILCCCRAAVALNWLAGSAALCPLPRGPGLGSCCCVSFQGLMPGIDGHGGWGGVKRNVMVMASVAKNPTPQYLPPFRI